MFVAPIDVDLGEGFVEPGTAVYPDDASKRLGAMRGRQITLRLRPGGDALALLEYRQVIGDRIYSSGHPAMQVLNPRVHQMIVLLDGRPPARPE